MNMITSYYTPIFLWNIFLTNNFGIKNDYIIENKTYLYDCEGILVTELGTGDGPRYPFGYPINTLVSITMGLEPHI